MYNVYVYMYTFMHLYMYTTRARVREKKRTNARGQERKENIKREKKKATYTHIQLLLACIYTCVYVCVYNTCFYVWHKSSKVYSLLNVVSKTTRELSSENFHRPSAHQGLCNLLSRPSFTTYAYTISRLSSHSLSLALRCSPSLSHRHLPILLWQAGSTGVTIHIGKLCVELPKHISFSPWAHHVTWRVCFLFCVVFYFNAMSCLPYQFND